MTDLKKITALGMTLICLEIGLTGCGGPKAVHLIDNLPEVNFDVDYPVGQITKDVTVTQSFISNCNQIDSIQLYGATYIRQNTATVQVRVLLTEQVGDLQGKELARFVLDSALMQDNSIIELAFGDGAEQAPCVVDAFCDKALNTKLSGKPCLIEITSPDGEPDFSPTFWMTEEDIYADGVLTVGGFEQYNDLWFQVKGLK